MESVTSDLKIVRDKNFHGIEFYGKDLPKDSDVYPDHPNPGGYGIKYNPKETRRGGKTMEAISGDLLHGMHDDPQYEKLYNEFADKTRARWTDNMKEWFSKEEDKRDGYESFERNEIDGRARQFIQPHHEDHKIFESELTPEMRNSGNKMVDYIKRKGSVYPRKK